MRRWNHWGAGVGFRDLGEQGSKESKGGSAVEKAAAGVPTEEVAGEEFAGEVVGKVVGEVGEEAVEEVAEEVVEEAAGVVVAAGLAAAAEVSVAVSVDNAASPQSACSGSVTGAGSEGASPGTAPAPAPAADSKRQPDPPKRRSQDRVLAVKEVLVATGHDSLKLSYSAWTNSRQK